MSLIPSESYSFPDHFTSTVTPSRKPKEKPEEQKQARKPAIVALPDPEPEPVLAAEPQVEEMFTAEPEPEPMLPSEPQFDPVMLEDPVAESELMAEIWEPEIPEVKAPPPPPPARPAPPPRPNPAMRRAQAPPPRVPDAPVRKIALPATLKPKVRWNNRIPAVDPARNGTNGNGSNGNGAHELPPQPAPAQNVIPMRPAAKAPPQSQPMPAPRPAPRPAPPAAVFQKPVQPLPARRPAAMTPPAPIPQRPINAPPPRKPVMVAPQARPVQARPRPVAPKPAPIAAPVAQSDFFETFAEDGYELANLRRKQMKFRRFLTCEAAALLVLLPLVILGLTLNISAPALRWIMNIFTIAAAVAAAVIPIAFYALTPTLPEIER